MKARAFLLFAATFAIVACDDDPSGPGVTEGRLRLDRLCRNGASRLSSPAGQGRHSSRNNKVVPAILRVAPVASDAASVASGLSIAIEAAMERSRKRNGDLQWRPSAPSRRPARTSSPAKS